MTVSASHASSVEQTLSASGVRAYALLESAPPDRVLRWIGLSSGDRKRQALRVGVVGWAPLILLAMMQGAFLGSDNIASLLREIAVHARYLVAAPLLVLAASVCAPQLDGIVQQFVRSRMVAETDAFKQVILTTQRLSISTVAETVLVVLAYAVVVATILSYAAADVPAWAKPGGITPIYSLAGWWHMLVSLPLLLLLIFGWIWRLALWTHLMWSLSRLGVRLVASHPDRCGGLGFLGGSVRSFSVVALALACIVAARSAHLVLEGSSLPTSNLYFSAGLVVTMMALFVAPLLTFTPVLMRTWRSGSFEYGALAGQIGRDFEEKWLEGQKPDEHMLSQPDFSATADLYAVVANARAIRFVPVELKDVIPLLAATLLPFLPVLLLLMPVNQILSHIKSLLF